MADSPVLDLGFARLDLGREKRQGIAEVVYGPGKTREQITGIVAGLDRVLAVQDRLRACDVVIVVAGMEGALASVVGGLVASPVIAVPTSAGYGSSFEGITAGEAT
jgi:pyridinium-3,5-biscarboxylic acid mononucleotide synthase